MVSLRPPTDTRAGGGQQLNPSDGFPLLPAAGENAGAAAKGGDGTATAQSGGHAVMHGAVPAFVLGLVTGLIFTVSTFVSGVADVCPDLPLLLSSYSIR